MTYLKDGRMKLSNNRAARSVKPFVIVRKNFRFANTPNKVFENVNLIYVIQIMDICRSNQTAESCSEDSAVILRSVI